ncbi:glycosyltransferase family 2 protein [Laribacter hongkongensis]|uniref:Glycosyl transferase, family 2 n=2 Tax=Laribacter hongkongensis TaxID=168471 RepID=C1D695_LARHH|nr:glycosyltransferase family 2 protein [Laribacter hongkongensis]ACO76130.1 Putative glycosyl transferase, family 2 [Laribacter hongkongensis HLHK9]MCG9024975.1 glycosyltransferase family 2 protein [Laribacter hongkongensis]MCG9057876.1 glycosyltransferase family 2 protein [Laribacter hongkongensis]MCG9084921.1 glycosyltransferase family 2 protein [Laribacter hongkongensis]MCG9097677.1 glycosyltransferase family 2 protein [Laribacter hongkongensis]
MPSVSATLIVRNEAARLARCLESVSAHVDEIVVVDTGSTDDTVAIASRFGCRIGHFAWNDDFSAARNAALSLSCTDWNFVIDADEWLVDPATLREAVRHVPDSTGLVCVRSECVLEGLRTHADCWIPRLLPATVRYQGRIHEHPASDLPYFRTRIVLGHDGYLEHPLNAHKKERNLPLLQAELVAYPTNPYLHYQAGKEFEVRDDFATAVHHYLQALPDTAGYPPYTADLVCRLLFCLKKLGRFDQAIPLAEHWQPHLADSADFLFVLGDLLLDYAIAAPADAPAILSVIEAAWLGCLELGTAHHHENSLPARGSFLASHNLSVLYAHTGQPDKAAHYAGLAQKQRQQMHPETA